MIAIPKAPPLPGGSWGSSKTGSVKVPAGGVAYLACAASVLREGRPYTVTVSAGDMIGA